MPQPQTPFPLSSPAFAPLSARERERVLHDIAEKTGARWRVPPRSFFLDDTTLVTRRLLGCLLINVTPARDRRAMQICGGRIVEAEAYTGAEDPACHAARGRTAATDILYREGGLAYVYKIYGVYFCVNAVAHSGGVAGAALLRALEPLCGLEEMFARRRVDPARPRDLCSGPGKLCQALAIDRRHNGGDFTAGPLLILCPERAEEPPIQSGPRVNVTRAADWPLRFWIAGSPWVSLPGKTL